MKTSILTSLLLLLACLSGCSRSENHAAGSHITGNLSFGEPVTLQAGSHLELRLTDVSISDGPALEVAKTIADIHTLPYAYSLDYDAAKINPQHRYTIDARIISNGAPRFSTDTAYEVLTQGHGAQRDMTLIANGSNGSAAPASMANASATTQPDMFQNELRNGTQVSLYKASLRDGHLDWLEEDRSNGTPAPLHARYEFKGALVMHYSDSDALEVSFDEHGKPTGISKQQKALQVATQMETINAIRNRAALLRSHALAASEARAHRLATGG